MQRLFTTAIRPYERYFLLIGILAIAASLIASYPAKAKNDSPDKERSIETWTPGGFPTSLINPLANTSLYLKNERVTPVGPAGDPDDNVIPGDDRMGQAVAIAGNLAVIGAPHDAMITPSDLQGSVYIFRFDGEKWNFEDKVTIVQNAGVFGEYVATDGNVVVVGVPGSPANPGGAVYIYSWNGTNWSSPGPITPQTDEGESVAGDLFGISVAVDGGIVAVGASGDSPFLNSGGMGSVSLFTTGGLRITKIRNNGIVDSGGDVDSDFVGRFGHSVDISGSEVIVGASEHDGSATNSGRAFLFGVGGNLIRTIPYSLSGGFFGLSVAIDDGTSVIGAYLHSKVFVVPSGGTTPIELIATGQLGGVGNGVAIDGDTIVFGTPGNHGAG